MSLPLFWTRSEYDQFLNGRWMLEAHECPFCDTSSQEEYRIWKWKYWEILYNKYPYVLDGNHIMAVPLTHKEFFTELTDEEVAEIKQVHEEVKKFFWDKTYFSFCREVHGQKSKSVKHYHIQFIAGELQGSYLQKMLQNQGCPVDEIMTER